MEYAGDYPDDNGAMLAYHSARPLCRSWLTRETYDVFRRRLKTGLPEWVSLFFEGVCAIDSGWRARGNGLANTVTQEAWRVFEMHLTKARDLLGKSWALRPDCPEAAAKMLIVAKAGHAAEGETARLWLDRARAACVDGQNSINQYLDILRPRWGGSRRELIEFASEGHRSRRFDSKLPNVVFQVCEVLEDEGIAAQFTWKTPEVANMVLDVARGRAAAPSLTNQRNSCASDLVYYAWLCGEHEEAARVLASLKQPMPPATLLRMAGSECDQTRLKLELAALCSPIGERFKEFDAQRMKGFPGTALEGYARLLSELPPESHDACAFLKLRQMQASFELNLQKGQWVEAPLRNDLLAWTVRAGDWTPGVNGLPQVKGSHGPARIVLAARMIEDYEFELVFERAGPPDAMSPVGVALGYGYHSTYGDTWQGISFERRPGPGDFMAGYSSSDQFTLGKTKLALQVPRSFKLWGSVKRRQMNFRLNDQPVCEGISLRPPHPPYNRFAFSSSSLGADESIRLTSLKFRRAND